MSSNNDLIHRKLPSLDKPRKDVCIFANRMLTNGVASDDCKFAQLILLDDWVGVKRCLDSIRDNRNIVQVLGKYDPRVFNMYKDFAPAHAQFPSSMDWKGAL